MLTNKTKTTIKNNLPYYVFALLVTILILVLWQGFRERPYKAIPNQVTPLANSGISGPKVDLNQKIFFASNGKDTAYKIKKGDKWSVIFKDVESKEYDFVSGAIFSSDGSQFAFSAENNGQAYVVVNNTQEIIAYRKAGYMVFNPAGTAIAFVSAKDSGFYVIITADVNSSVPITMDGTETEEFDQIGTATDSEGNIVSIVYSSDGEEIVYIIEKDDGVCVVVNGEEGETYDSITDLSLNDDGTISYTAEDGNETVTVVNNTVTSTSTSTNTDNNNDYSDDDDYSDTSSTSTTNTDYKYKILTDIDINRSASDETNTTTTCPAGQTCNF